MPRKKSNPFSNLVSKLDKEQIKLPYPNPKGFDQINSNITYIQELILKGKVPREVSVQLIKTINSQLRLFQLQYSSKRFLSKSKTK